MKTEFSTWSCFTYLEHWDVRTCCHVFQHLQQHVLGFINELSALHYQFPQAQIAVEHRADQPTFEMSLDGLHLHERRQQSYGKHQTYNFTLKKKIKNKLYLLHKQLYLLSVTSNFVES